MIDRCLALLYYDYFLTFPAEVKYIWSRRFTVSTIIYICCRYALLANLLFLLATSNVLSNCDRWYTVAGYLSVAGRTAVLIIFTARTWAIYGRNMIILYGLGALAVVCIAVDFWHVSGETCTGTKPPNIQLADNLLPIIMSAFTCIGTALNVYRCFKAMKKLHWRHGVLFGDSFISFMLRESLIYFCGVFSLTFTSVLLHFEEPSGFMNRLLNALTLPVTGLLSARLILKLREWSDRTLVQVSAYKRTGQAGTPYLRSAINLSFHAATVEHLTSSAEFGKDYMDYVHHDLGVDGGDHESLA